jgi:hypothetical protein
MESTYSYRFLKSSWGIAIDLTAVAVRAGNFHDAIAINQGIWLKIQNNNLTSEEVGFLVLGLGLVSESIRATCAEELPILINGTHGQIM